MKKFFLLIAGLALFSAVVGCVVGASAKEFGGLFAARKSIKGSGVLVTRTVKVGKFDAVEASRAIRVDIRSAQAGEAVVEADDNLMDKVVVKVDGGTLKIGFDKSVESISDHHVTVTVPYSEHIGSLKASSAARIVCEQPLKASEVELKASSAAVIKASAETDECSVKASSASRIDCKFTGIECELEASSSAHIVADVTAADCEIDLSSASKLEIEGSALRCDADVSSAATLSAERFEIKTAEVDASSGSSARVRCTGSLKAGASSGASIRYSGDCRVEARTSSGGSIREK